MMSYKLSWQVLDKVIFLQLYSVFTVEDAKQINEQLSVWLDNSKTPIYLVIDAQEVSIPVQFEEIRNLQRFVTHRRLGHIFIISNKKMIRLSMMVMYNYSTCFIRLFLTHDEANKYLELRFKYLT